MPPIFLVRMLAFLKTAGDERISDFALYWEMLVYNDIRKNASSPYILVDPYL